MPYLGVGRILLFLVVVFMWKEAWILPPLQAVHLIFTGWLGPLQGVVSCSRLSSLGPHGHAGTDEDLTANKSLLFPFVCF